MVTETSVCAHRSFLLQTFRARECDDQQRMVPGQSRDHATRSFIKNSLGHALGTAYNKIYSYGQNQKCQAGVEDYSGKLLCYTPEYPNILYVFNGPWTNVAEGKMPPADVLQGWALESIIWRPKS